jgi:hypothetical protein
MASAELTVTLPNNIVHNKKLPLFLTGKIFSALRASISSYSLVNGPFVNNSKFLTSKPSKPKFNPENIPESIAKNTIAIIVYTVTYPLTGSKSSIAS